jgi:cyclophilin family peptidyl-prolyl cis-trans isomerase
VAKRTRHRQLARQVAQRRADRQRQHRRRQLATITVALFISVIGGVVLFWTLVLGEDGTLAPNPTPEPGTQTGTVDPEPGPREVACDADTPPGALRPKPQFNAPAEVLRDDESYTATLETSCGDIVVRMLSDRAPETVNSFVFLAQQDYFDGTRIHRIDESIDVLQGGDPIGTGTSSPGYSIPDELTGDETYPPGTLAMANSGPNTGGSQFFIITGADGHNLDANPNYTIFGRVIDGLDVAQEIQQIPVQDPGAGIEGQQPAQAVYVERVTISTER